MLRRIIEWSVANPFFVVLATLAVVENVAPVGIAARMQRRLEVGVAVERVEHRDQVLDLLLNDVAIE